MKTENSYSDEDFCFPMISEREMAAERLLFNTTEDILLAMEDARMARADVAKKLGKSTAYVSQLLCGTRNMTLKTLADIAYALDAEARVVICKDGRDVSHPIVSERKHYVAQSSDITHEPMQMIRITITPSNADRVTNVIK